MPSETQFGPPPKSFLELLITSVLGPLLGVLLLLAAGALLVWNEVRTLHRTHDLAAAQAKVVAVNADRVDPAHEGALVHTTGEADTREGAADPDLGVAFPVLSLRRHVEIYQWKEAKGKKTEGNDEVATYTYTPTWSDNPINSGSFHQPEGHRNEGSLPFQDGVWPAVDARLGAFHLSAPLLGELTNEEPLPVTKEEAARLAPAFHDRLTVQEGKFYQRSDQASQPAGAEEEGPPQIGDVRISYKGVRPTTISVIARQQGDSLAPSESGEEGSFQLVEVGAHSKEEMLQQAATRNANTTWFLRGSGAILMLLGLGLIWLGLLWRKKTRRTYEDRRPKVSRA